MADQDSDQIRPLGRPSPADRSSSPLDMEGCLRPSGAGVAPQARHEGKHGQRTGMLSLFSSTPAKSLPRALPHGAGPVDVLVLQQSGSSGLGGGGGSGGSTFDLRDVFFTAYAERGGTSGGSSGGGGEGSWLPERTDGGIRVLVCRDDAGLVARDVLFLSMLLDARDTGDEPKSEQETMWEVFHNLLISREAHGKVVAQAEKLVDLLTGNDGDLVTWASSPYGRAVSFRDVASLREARMVWSQYASPESETAIAEQLLASLRLSTNSGDGEGADIDKAISLSGLRSAAPVPLASSGVVLEGYKRFWEEGRLCLSRVVEGSSVADAEVSRVPNPTVTSCVSTVTSANTMKSTNGLDTTTNPLLGYHLGTALARLAPGSPLSTRENEDGGSRYDHVLASIRTQFREWTSAYRVLAGEGRIRTEFCIRPPVELLHDLANISDIPSSQEGLTQKETGIFDVIDTTSLADQYGFLDLLVAARPLLKPSPMSILYTETLRRRPDLSYKQNLDFLMCGDASLHSLVIGLSPVEYWTNTNVESCIDDVLIKGSYENGEMEGGLLKNNFRSSWRLTSAFTGQSASESGISRNSLVSMDGESAAAMFLAMLKMGFSQETVLPFSDVTTASAELHEDLQSRTERLVSLVAQHVKLDLSTVAERLEQYSPGLAAMTRKAESSGTVPSVTASNTAVKGDVTFQIEYLGADKFEMSTRFDWDDEEGASLLEENAPVELRQKSPFVVTVVARGDGVDKSIRDLVFPLPVHASKIRTSTKQLQSSGDKVIAPPSVPGSVRTRITIELTAGKVDPLELEDFSDLILPTSSHNGTRNTPIILNNHSVNLDSLPIISVDNDTEASRKANSWLSTLTSQQFSTRERKERELALEDDTTLPSAKLNLKESLFTIFMLASGLQGGSTGLFTLSHPEKGNQILIFVRSLRIDGSVGSVVADAAVLPITRELLDSGELEGFLLVLRELEACVIDVSDEELVLWKRVLPALVERCRTWDHREDCEYFSYSTGTIPLSVEPEKAFLCSCGNGKLPPRYMGGLPEWEEAAARHAVRVAISPLFAVPWVEEIMDVELVRSAGGVEGMVAAAQDRCRRCGATQREGGTGGETGNSSGDKRPLMRCTRCKDALYCSQECQKKDWKKHRMECRAPGQAE